MENYEHARHQTGGGGGFWTSRSGFILWAFLAMGGALLFTEHRAHVLGILPFLFLLACPLLHMFGHGDHSGHRQHSDQDNSGAQEATENQVETERGKS